MNDYTARSETRIFVFAFTFRGERGVQALCVAGVVSFPKTRILRFFVSLFRGGRGVVARDKLCSFLRFALAWRAPLPSPEQGLFVYLSFRGGRGAVA